MLSFRNRLHWCLYKTMSLHPDLMWSFIWIYSHLNFIFSAFLIYICWKTDVHSWPCIPHLGKQTLRGFIKPDYQLVSWNQDFWGVILFHKGGLNRQTYVTMESYQAWSHQGEFTVLQSSCWTKRKCFTKVPLHRLLFIAAL